jgi:DNA-binding CsgD family transcriptional regulator/PAS domain-containing protein
MIRLFQSVPGIQTRAIDEPLSPWRDLDGAAILASRYYQEWAKPQGLIDSISVPLMRTADRWADIGLGRSETVGLITEREVRLLRLLAPHLRRVVAISDLIDMKSLQAKALTETLDVIAAGVVLVGKDGSIVHANRAAERMFERGGPIRSANGRLAGGDSRTNAELQGVIAEAAREEAQLGAAGIGMMLAGSDGSLGTAHVLPLARGDRRTRLDPRALAAVFVASSDAPPQVDLGPIAKAYGLTPAETAFLAQVALGWSVAEAAAHLGVARTTAKTHMSRILAKTGTRRQPALMSLIQRLAPAIVSTARRESDE